MSDFADLASQIVIEVDGVILRRTELVHLVEVTVEQDTQLPGMFTLRFDDPELHLLDDGPFNLAKPVKIVAQGADGSKTELIDGEITALEPEFCHGMNARLTVRGYDRLHRLYRETRSKAYVNAKDSEIAATVARSAGLRTEIDETSTVYEHLFQCSQSDLAFLRQRAFRIGYECFVDRGKLLFRKPRVGEASATLTWGRDLVEFLPRLTLAEQVDEVVVRGWDVARQTPIVGRATEGALYPQIGEDDDGATWGRRFGTGRKVIVDRPVVSQAEADVLAAAKLDDISGAFIEADGQAIRRPDLRAGQVVNLQALGRRLSGHYLLSSVTHRYGQHGLTTQFSMRGIRSGLLSDLLAQYMPPGFQPFAVHAVVTNTDDPNAWGRVKVKYPWLSDDVESGWARVIGVGAGPETGLVAIPHVGDEVLVALLYGEFDQAVVVGGFWNGQHAIPPENASAKTGEQPHVRTWRSRKGHRIAIYDNSTDRIEVVTAQGHSLVLDDAKDVVSFTSKNGSKLIMDDAKNKVTLTSTDAMDIHAGQNLTIEASGTLKLKGTAIEIDGSASVEVKGGVIRLN